MVGLPSSAKEAKQLVDYMARCELAESFLLATSFESEIISVLDADLKAGTFDQEELLPARALEPLERVEEWCVLDSLLRALSVLPVFCSKSMYAPKD
eukprot:g11375.t1